MVRTIDLTGSINSSQGSINSSHRTSGLTGRASLPLTEPVGHLRLTIYIIYKV